jgi:hypothetical protein
MRVIFDGHPPKSVFSDYKDRFWENVGVKRFLKGGQAAHFHPTHSETTHGGDRLDGLPDTHPCYQDWKVCCVSKRRTQFRPV